MMKLLTGNAEYKVLWRGHEWRQRGARGEALLQLHEEDAEVLPDSAKQDHVEYRRLKKSTRALVQKTCWLSPLRRLFVITNEYCTCMADAYDGLFYFSVN